MNRVLTGLILCCAAAGWLAAQSKGDAAAGKAAYEKSCRACHGATGAGNPAIAKSLNVTIRPLGSKEVQAKTDAELKKSMLGGYGKKKPVKVNDQQVLDITAYVRSLAVK